MGRSDPHLVAFYKPHFKLKGDVALLGEHDASSALSGDVFGMRTLLGEGNAFRTHHGDLYDLQLGNWNINSDWSLEKKYDTIICTRCPYFAKDPEDFIRRCHDHLNPGGRLIVDWGLGDHWRSDNYKIGWVKNGEHEQAYADDNFLWSTVWDDSFEEHEHYKYFCKKVEKLGYTDVKKAIFDEVPEILMLDTVKKYFDVCYDIYTLWEDFPQLYILLSCEKKK